MRSPLLVSAALAVGLTFAGLTLAAPQATSIKLTSTLKASSEVPKPTGVRPGATGTFTGTAVQASGERACDAQVEAHVREAHRRRRGRSHPHRQAG